MELENNILNDFLLDVSWALKTEGPNIVKSIGIYLGLSPQETQLCMLQFEGKPATRIYSVIKEAHHKYTVLHPGCSFLQALYEALCSVELSAVFIQILREKNLFHAIPIDYTV